MRMELFFYQYVVPNGTFEPLIRLIIGINLKTETKNKTADSQIKRSNAE
jgi:hypothetical protein